MNARSRTAGRTAWVAVRATILFTLLLGIAYPLALTAVGQLALPDRASGSMLRGPEGTAVGSTLIGQAFTDAAGAPLPRYFQSRPSAAGKGYDGAASGGSNLGPENPELMTAIRDRRARIAAFDGVPASRVPADAVTVTGTEAA